MYTYIRHIKTDTYIHTRKVDTILGQHTPHETGKYTSQAETKTGTSAENIYTRKTYNICYDP